MNMKTRPTPDLYGQPDFEQKLAMLRGIADSSRLRILEALAFGSLHMLEIVDVTGLNQPNTSNHLAYLLGCRLIVRERSGRFAYYSLADGVATFLSCIDRLSERQRRAAVREEAL